MKKILLIKYGEIALRGKNRYLFENRIINTLKEKLENFEGYKVLKEQGRFAIENDHSDVDYELIIPKIQKTLGIISFCLGIKTEDTNIENLKEKSLEYIKENYPNSSFSFKVETKRCDKKYPLKSGDISAMIGGYILENLENIRVDVHKPDVVLFVEMRNYVYIYSKEIKGFGGLPFASSGKGTLLLSGGFDSPVAGFLMAKRGTEIEAVYFHSPPFTSEKALDKVKDLAKTLTEFTGHINLHIVKFTELQTFLYERVPEDKLTIFLKRAMLKISEEIAKESKSLCLITGDSVGQVASQTLQAISAVNSASNLPIIRPLAGMDKQEIMDISKKIGTYDISARPFEDCCTIFVAKHPETRPKTSVVEKMEEKLAELPEYIINATETREILRL